MPRRYKGRPSGKTIARDFPFVVEIAVPPGGLGKRLNDMHAFHNQRGIQVAHIRHRHADDGDHLLWCFARRAIASPLNLVARRWDKKTSQPAAHGDDARVRYSVDSPHNFVGGETLDVFVLIALWHHAQQTARSVTPLRASRTFFS